MINSTASIKAKNGTLLAAFGSAPRVVEAVGPAVSAYPSVMKHSHTLFSYEKLTKSEGGGEELRGKVSHCIKGTSVR